MEKVRCGICSSYVGNDNVDMGVYTLTGTHIHCDECSDLICSKCIGRKDVVHGCVIRYVCIDCVENDERKEECLKSRHLVVGFGK